MRPRTIPYFLALPWALSVPFTANRLPAQDQSTVAAATTVVHPTIHPAGHEIFVPQVPRVIGQDASLPDHKKHMPPLPVGTGNLPQPESPPTLLSSEGGVTAGCALRFFSNEVVTPAGASTSNVGEPSAAQTVDTVWFTGNWFAGRSIDYGQG
jgi:hypothetical protein